ncbi:MAG TPA: chromosomal replication initiator protein DnaA [Candidatus Hydrogenedentes bacterium]|nr:chromosomal replication initiator protein DnaA [Candidatus Hydrogenedentota bacterium]
MALSADKSTAGLESVERETGLIRDPWHQAKTVLADRLDEHSFKNWIEPTVLEVVTDGVLYVRVPSQFFADWLKEHYLDAVTDVLRGLLPEFQEVRFLPLKGQDGSIQEQAADRGQDTAHPVAARSSRVLRPVPPPSKGAEVKRRIAGFNPRYTFDRFVVGEGNKFPYAAAVAVRESPGRVYNPLFIYGGTGLGKTHLMQAIGQGILAETPERKVAYISSEEFTNQLIRSIADRTVHRFREKFRRVDVLLIDDVHFISGKEATQEEFFHTFNALFDAHKQIVLSSDRSPKELAGVESRLVSRFEWGLVTDIQPPDLETRVAILQNKAREERVKIPVEYLRLIALHVNSNIRELEGALTTVLAYSSLNGAKITMELVETVLRDLIRCEKVKSITVDQIQQEVAKRYDVRIADLKSRSRQRQVVVPRQVAMYLCKTLIPSMSLSDIGEHFGGKDHTTVLHSVSKIESAMRNDALLRDTVDQLSRTLRG